MQTKAHPEPRQGEERAKVGHGRQRAWFLPALRPYIALALLLGLGALLAGPAPPTLSARRAAAPSMRLESWRRGCVCHMILHVYHR